MVKLISRQGSIPDSYIINLALCDYKNRIKRIKAIGSVAWSSGTKARSVYNRVCISEPMCCLVSFVLGNHMSDVYLISDSNGLPSSINGYSSQIDPSSQIDHRAYIAG